MSLRVLLADESTTIKKVMQLALQDFAVEVKAVHSGIDVVEVARQFQPDIIFADILLQKKNGYEVSADLKADPELNRIPTVLMWSSFMDLDESQAALSHADSRLEKPFDVENLRQVVLSLVPQARGNRAASYLKYPESISAPLKEEARAAQAPTATPTAMTPPPPVPPSHVAPPPRPPSAARPAAPSAPPPPPPTHAAPMPPPRPAATTATPPVRTPPPALSLETDSDEDAHALTPPGRHLPPPPTPAPAAPPPRQAPPRPETQQAPTPPPATASAKASGWNMESFEDISQFANLSDIGATSASEENEIGPELSADLTFSSEPNEDDEDGSAFKMTTLKATRSQVTSAAPTPPPARTAPQAATKSATPKRPQAEAGGFGGNEDAEEPWSHQDLSRFKVELSPVEVEGEEFALTVDPNENDVEATAVMFQAPKERLSDRIAEHIATARANEHLPIELELEPEIANAHEIELSDFSTSDYENLEVEVHEPSAPAPRARDLQDLGEGQIPQLSPERLEQIVRAQSREIIESVVRKIVPDLASELIREELERLLSESPTHRP
jgi:CheY-like chemotaxis protein